MSQIVRPAAVAALPASRRRFLTGVGQATLSATAVALIVGCQSNAASQSGAQMAKSDPAADAAILNVALGLEHEAIAAYQLGAESGLLQKGVLDVAVGFQSHHKQHRDALIGVIKQLGGTPVAAMSNAEYAKALNAGALKNQADVLDLAARLELGATNAYLSVIPAFTDTGFSQIAGRLAADETLHWTVLTSALGRPLPKDALSFGA